MRSKNIKNIAVIGAGYVGLSTAVVLANTGYKVSLIENNDKRLKTLKTGKSFFFEAGVNELLSYALNYKYLTITSDAHTVLDSSDIIFSCVGTPENPDGSSNLRYVYEVAELVAMQAKNNCIFVQKSTVPVGTGQKIEDIFHENGCNIKYASNPEFLREGTAIIDTLYFDRIVIGSNSKLAAKTVLDTYKSVEQKREKLANIANIKPAKNKPGKYIITTRNSAELTKVTANAFLALKISFANSIAKLADATGSDIREVMDAVGEDKRIGRSFLNAGRGYGGGCFPKDVSGLIRSAEQYGIDMSIMTAAQDINESMPSYITKKAKKAMGTLKGKNVAVLGLAFKAGTSDARKSPGVKIANILDKAGAIVTAYDPRAMDEAKKDLRKNVNLSKSTKDAIKNKDAIFIAVDWPEFQYLGYPDELSNCDGVLLVDAVNYYDTDYIKLLGFKYLGVGRSY